MHCKFNDLLNRDLILIFLDNGIEFVSIFYAVLEFKGIFFPIDTNFSKVNLSAIIKKLKIRFVITEKKYIKHFQKIGCSVLDINEPYPSINVKRNIAVFRKFSSKVICQLTSGSTGESKPIFRTYADLLEEAEKVSARLKLKKSDTLFCPLKLSHSFTLTTCLTSILFSGGSFTGIKNFVPSELLSSLKMKITILAANPYIYELLNRMKRQSIINKNVRIYVSAGAKLSNNTIKIFYKNFKAYIAQLYGMTETGAISINFPTDKKELYSCGKPFSHIKIKISRTGCIDIYKKNILYRTNDIGKRTDRNNLIISGRKDNLIELHGKKIDPKIVKDVIKLCSGVLDAKVYKKNFLHAEIISSKKIPENKLYEFCLNRMPRYMIPCRFIKVDTILEKRLV